MSDKPKKLAPLSYTNLLGETIVIGPKKKVNPMLVCGKGPEDKRCKHCAHFIVKEFHNKTYFKCEFRGDTNGAGTDHRANWPTCAKFVTGESPN